ncbi:putative HTH-type transcriptional regulat or in the TAR-I ttuE-ttuC' intergenic region [Micromonospora saelicesensis]|uniref:Putative HTH-type transcriptional regulat or in the TAR-I ttuE-ttuC' intergenic region n=1 Tax=Micromonospora saelicesensis TaxID=285676 RepID=A0A328NNB3_9ACTN|nr:GntR family transcriptional regulator [Micromonospora saelicesensis]RAO35784.1 putative HTH-type transcriptional regulat or in the TAR-I ttuE-ttuC' intergenic region [Micromonospora saelicesensis]
MTDQGATREASLTQQAYATLRTRIVTCELPPGSSLTERGLARSTPYGLTPIRRALARLDRDGLIITLPRAGYVVSPLDAQDVSELVEAWDLIGPELVRLGLERLSDVQAQELAGLLSEWSPPDSDGGHQLEAVLRFSALSMRVFQVLAIASANRWLRSAFEQLSDQMSRLWVTLLKGREVPEQLQQLIDRWNRHIAGRQPEEIAEHLPQLIKDSGRAARDLFHDLATTPGAHRPL